MPISQVLQDMKLDIKFKTSSRRNNFDELQVKFHEPNLGSISIGHVSRTRASRGVLAAGGSTIMCEWRAAGEGRPLSGTPPPLMGHYFPYYFAVVIQDVRFSAAGGARTAIGAGVYCNLLRVDSKQTLCPFNRRPRFTSGDRNEPTELGRRGLKRDAAVRVLPTYSPEVRDATGLRESTSPDRVVPTESPAKRNASGLHKSPSPNRVVTTYSPAVCDATGLRKSPSPDSVIPTNSPAVSDATGLHKSPSPDGVVPTYSSTVRDATGLHESSTLDRVVPT
ncbi:hypothetical protein EVAR_103417_1 [Eumeta japonica]|uniref:Uncharacterized protein n=1 Tax=Eumeta variegata TaxID=151549 RepID=A0A4C1ZBB5_EUMVA|nr:hypothetical protein EVAR_103417_1 [Eumeta japonica]